MGLFDRWFRRNEPKELPPISGGDASSPETAAIINCAAMTTADHLIDRFISERHGKKEVDWERGIEMYVERDDIPPYTIRLIGVQLKHGDGPSYYFDIGRPVQGTKNLLKMMGKWPVEHDT